jgi:hypothetical protein
MAQALIAFDYSALGKDAISVRESTVRIKALQRSASESIVEIGKELIEVKERLKHGQFLDWIATEFGWSQSGAYRFISVSKKFSDSSQIGNIGPITPSRKESRMIAPLYSVGTWDTDSQGYTPQVGVPAFNLTLGELRQSLRMLRQQGNGAWRVRDEKGDYDSDWFVLVERTDGMSEVEILEKWKR